MDNAGTEQNFREMKGHTYVLTLLQNLIRRRELVRVIFPGDETCYLSTVLQLEPQKNTLLLDDIFPRSGHQLLENHGEARFYAYMGGGALEFSARLHSVSNDDGLFFFRMHLPETVEYLQRRDGHRVTVIKLDITAELHDQKGVAHRAKLYDFSTGGASFIIGGNTAFQLNTPYTCIFHLPDGSKFSTQLTFCDQRSIENRVEVIGGSFTDLDAQKENFLRRCTVDLERRLLRLRHGPPPTPPKPGGK